jgi:hypothetical protein
MKTRSNAVNEKALKLRKIPEVTQIHKGGFHLHLLVFPFIYQFHFRIEALVCSLFANEGFQQHFSIISKSLLLY